MDNGLLRCRPYIEGRTGEVVLILIVMDNGLLPPTGELKLLSVVLILIVMDNGLLHMKDWQKEFILKS